MCVIMYIIMCAHMSVCVHMCVCVCVCVYVHVCMYVCVYACVYFCVCVHYAFMNTYMYHTFQIPGVLIFRFIAPFCFTNAALFMSRLAAACEVDPSKQNSSSTNQRGCIEVAYYKVIYLNNAYSPTIYQEYIILIFVIYPWFYNLYMVCISNVYIYTRIKFKNFSGISITKSRKTTILLANFNFYFWHVF